MKFPTFGSGAGRPKSATRIKRPRGRVLWLALGGIVVALVAVWFFFLRGGDETDPYRTETVSRGDITQSVSASGTLGALVTVQVGSQLSGQVTQVLADFNDRVRRGQTLAVLDAQTYDSRIEQSRAQVASSNASVAQAEANVALAQAEYDRQRFLFERQIIAQAALDTASAQLATARASLQSARANVAQQQAALRANQVERGRTVITSPIDGVVIDRQIEPGQTVASGLNVAVLFTVAESLSRLKAEISVDEADIGQVREGQAVRFTVDAFPSDTFTGTVTQVRSLPRTEANVVAYTVVVEADNPGERLLPGMTANADIILERRANVLRVPSAALRFTPANMQAPRGAQGGGGPPGFGGAPGVGGGGFGGGGGRQMNRQGQGDMSARILEELQLDEQQRNQVRPILERAAAQARAGGGGGAGGRGQGGARRAAMAAAFNEAFDEIRPLLRADQQARLETARARFAGGGGQRGVVWVLRDGQPVAVPVQIGASDGSFTEVLSGELREGDQVIVGGGPRAPATAQPQGRGGGGVRVRI